MKTETTISVTKKMYGWSKYGGVMDGIVKEELPEWFCQFCGGKQVKGLPCYMIAVDEWQREYLRACSVCKNAAVKNKATTFDKLLVVVSERRYLKTSIVTE